MKEQEFFEKMAAVWLELAKLKGATEAIEQEMKQLENAGMVNATIHVRSDNGGMELLHPSGSTYEQDHNRRREYIGKNPDKQLEARCRVKRYQTHQSLKAELQKKIARTIEIERQVGRLELIALGKQSSLFSDMGTAGVPGTSCTVPIDVSTITPAMVVDYFKNSPVLSVHASAVETVLVK